MIAGQLYSLLGILLTIGVFVGLRVFTAKKTRALPAPTIGLDALRSGFAQTRAQGESEPVCVIAGHYTGYASVEPVVIGVTNHRILVFKGTGPMHSFPYDYEGEHLPDAEKNRQGRGFFAWKHSKKGSVTGYCPVVKNYPPFTGQQWWIFPESLAFAQQKDNLRQFADIFYFGGFTTDWLSRRALFKRARWHFDINWRIDRMKCRNCPSANIHLRRAARPLAFITRCPRIWANYGVRTPNDPSCPILTATGSSSRNSSRAASVETMLVASVLEGPP